MNVQYNGSSYAVRRAWSDEERRIRRRLAWVMQRRLRELVVISELANAPVDGKMQDHAAPVEGRDLR